MQKLPLPFTAGDAVIARGERWIVENATAYDDCVLFRLTAGKSGGEARRAHLLYPCDRPVVARVDRRPRVVNRRRWVRQLENAIATLHRSNQLTAARAAAIDIFPFQLEPALALLRGTGSRMLLADEVGLGKTIQAALILAELRERGLCERALVVAPSGLCRQWTDELRTRFGVAGQVFDAAEVARLSATLPLDLNPWSVAPTIVTSIDFLKQPEVLGPAGSIIWDLVIVDEAHRATPSSRRYAAVDTIARRARHVVLITATPHDGDEPAYRSLCSIGQIGGDDALVLFRRTRQSVGLPRRRKVRLLSVRPTFDEEEMHRLVGCYAKRLWHAGGRGRTNAQLVAMVLSKRAMSSASSLRTSIARRIEALVATETDGPVQSSLLLTADDDAVADNLLASRGLEHGDEEGTLLREILAVAERAAKAESKLRALLRLLRRTTEPAVVFTEYRDTLANLAHVIGQTRRIALLHGGLSLEERRLAVTAFNAGRADLLLATDAGAEGLNLQTRSRLVINLELPWNPIRLEQRIGRVDRLGQTRVVHVVNLFAAGTSEAHVLANLHKRLDAIRSSDIQIAACIIDNQDTASIPESGSRAQGRVTASGVGNDANAEAARLLNLKTSRRRAADREQRRPLVCVSRRRHAEDEPGALWIFLGKIVSESGGLIEEVLVPLLAKGSADRGTGREPAKALLKRYGDELADIAKNRVRQRADAISAEAKTWTHRSAAREAQLAAIVRSRPPLFQAGLFDRRTLMERASDESHRSQLADEAASRISQLERQGSVLEVRDPQLTFLLLRC